MTTIDPQKPDPRPPMIEETPEDRAKAIDLLEAVVEDGHSQHDCWAMNSPGYHSERQFYKDPARADKECDCHILLVKEALALLKNT